MSNREMRPRPERSLTVHQGELARRALSELAPADGGTLIISQGCPFAHRLAPQLPAPVRWMRSLDEARESIVRSTYDLILLGTDQEGWEASLHVMKPLAAYRSPFVWLHSRPQRYPTWIGVDGCGGYAVNAWDGSEDLFDGNGFSDLLERCARLASLFRSDAWRKRPTGRAMRREERLPRGLALLLSGATRWRRTLPGTREGELRLGEDRIEYVLSEDPDLAAHLETHPDLDFVLCCGCACEMHGVMPPGQVVAEERGVPCIVPTDCGFPRLAFNLPSIWACWEDTIDGYCTGTLQDSVPAALLERAAWLHAHDRPWEHLAP